MTQHAARYTSGVKEPSANEVKISMKIFKRFIHAD